MHWPHFKSPVAACGRWLPHRRVQRGAISTTAGRPVGQCCVQLLSVQTWFSGPFRVLGHYQEAARPSSAVATLRPGSASPENFAARAITGRHCSCIPLPATLWANSHCQVIAPSRPGLMDLFSFVHIPVFYLAILDPFFFTHYCSSSPRPMVSLTISGLSLDSCVSSL